MNASNALKTKLLALGGANVFVQADRYLNLLLTHGRSFSPKGRKRIRGAMHRCDTNAALYYAKHHGLDYGGICEVVTGYALYEDGLWAGHSWLWDGKRVIDTNTDPSLYFGVILPPFEAAKFVSSEVMSRLPGYRDVECHVAA